MEKLEAEQLKRKKIQDDEELNNNNDETEKNKEPKEQNNNDNEEESIENKENLENDNKKEDLKGVNNSFCLLNQSIQLEHNTELGEDIKEKEASIKEKKEYENKKVEVKKEEIKKVEEVKEDAKEEVKEEVKDEVKEEVKEEVKRFAEIKKERKVYAMCPNCAQIPNLTIDFKHPEQILYTCSACKYYKKEISLESYFDKMNNKESPDSDLKELKCTIHDNNGIVSYCLKCNKNCCPTCEKMCEIQHHPSISISKNNKAIIDKITEELNLKKKCIFEKIENQKDYYIKELQSKIESLKNSFENFKKRNEQVYKYLIILLNTLEDYPTQKVEDNYQTNFSWNNEEFTDDIDILSKKNFDNFLKYIDTFVLVKESFDVKKFEQKKKIKKHRDIISSLLQLKDGRIVSASFDGMIIIFNTNFNFAYQIDSHKENVSSMIEVNKNILVTCSFDRYIKTFVLNDNNFNSQFSVYSHRDNIYQLINLPDNKFASCSEDKKIIIWDYSLKKLMELTGHATGVKGMILEDNEQLIISISDDKTLRQWDYQNNKKSKIITQLENCYFISSIIQCDHYHVLIGSFNQVLLVNFRQEGEKQISIVLNDTKYGYIDSIISYKKGLFLLSCYEGIIVYNHYTKNINEIKVYDTNHSKAVSALLKIGDNSFISGSLDNSIIIWEYKENESKIVKGNELVMNNAMNSIHF